MTASLASCGVKNFAPSDKIFALLIAEGEKIAELTSATLARAEAMTAKAEALLDQQAEKHRKEVNEQKAQLVRAHLLEIARAAERDQATPVN